MFWYHIFLLVCADEFTPANISEATLRKGNIVLDEKLDASRGVVSVLADPLLLWRQVVELSLEHDTKDMQL